MANYFDKYATEAVPDVPQAGSYFDKYDSEETGTNYFDKYAAEDIHVEPPAPAEPVPTEEPGFIQSSILDQLIAGTYELASEYQRKGAVEDISNRYHAMEAGTNDPNATDMSYKQLSEFGQAQDPKTRKAALKSVYDELQATLDKATKYQAKSEAIPLSKETSDFMDPNSKTPMLQTPLKDLPKIMVELASRSGAASAPGLVAGMTLGAAATVISGGTLSAAGFAAGSGWGSYQVQYANTLLNELKKKGVDFTSADSVLAATGNKELMQEVQKKAVLEATMVAGPDALAALFGAKMLTPAIKNKIMQELVNLGVQIGIQAPLGAVGEAGRELVANEDFQPRQIAAEALAEPVGAAIEIGGAAASGARQIVAEALAKPAGAAASGARHDPGEPPPDGPTKPGAPPAGPIESTSQQIDELEKLIQQDEAEASTKAQDEARAASAVAGGDLLSQELAASEASAGAAAGQTQRTKERVDGHLDVLAQAELDAGLLASDTYSGDSKPPMLPIPTGAMVTGAVEPSEAPPEVIEAAKPNPKGRHTIEVFDDETGKWEDLGEGPFKSLKSAERFRDAEVGMTSRIKGPNGKLYETIHGSGPTPLRLVTTSSEVVAPAPEVVEAAKLPPVGEVNPEGELVTNHVMVVNLPGTVHARDNTPPDTDYGSFANTKGADGDEIDFIRFKGQDSGRIFVVDQLTKKGEGEGFEQHKVLAGFPNQVAARRAHKAMYPNNKAAAITEMTPEQFRAWAMQPQTAPVSSKVKLPAAPVESKPEYVAKAWRRGTTFEAVQREDGKWITRSRANSKAQWGKPKVQSELDTLNLTPMTRPSGRVKFAGRPSVKIGERAEVDTSPRGPMDLLEVLAKSGMKLNLPALSSEFDLDPADVKNLRPLAHRGNLNGIFTNKGGESAERLLEFMLDNNYLQDEGWDSGKKQRKLDNRDAYDLLIRAIYGERIVSHDQTDEEAAYQYGLRQAEEELRNELNPEDIDQAVEVVQRGAALAPDISEDEFDRQVRAAFEGQSKRMTKQEAEDFWNVDDGSSAKTDETGTTEQQGEAPSEPAIVETAAKPAGPTQSSLIAGPTAAETVAATGKALEATRQGLGRDLVPVEEGEGELFAGNRAGERPAQAEIETKSEVKPKKVSKPKQEMVAEPQLFVEWSGRRYPVASIEDAQKKWDQFRETSLAGASEIGSAQVTDDSGKTIGKISYNGRYWPAGSDTSKSRYKLADKPADPFYSALHQAVQQAQGMPKKAPASEFKAWLDGQQRKGNIKQEERDWIGVDAWLTAHEGPVTREELQAFVRDNQVVVTDKVLQEPELEATIDMLPAKWGIEEGPAGFFVVDENGKYLSDVFPTEKTAIIDALKIHPWVTFDPKDGKPIERFETEEQAIEAVKGTQLDHGMREEFFGKMGDVNLPKFVNYQLPGGENYRELLLTLPRRTTVSELRDKENNLRHDMHAKYGDGWINKVTQEEFMAIRELDIAAEKAERNQNFRQSHFDQPNILVWVRYNERTDADGKRVLFLEEIQSDWHQQGRRKGYKEKPLTVDDIETKRVPFDVVMQEDSSMLRYAAEWRKENDVDPKADFVLWRLKGSDHPWNTSFDPNMDAAEQLRKLEEETHGSRLGAGYIENEIVKRREGVPDAPFKKSWPLLAMKRMIRWAVENDFDGIAWTTGEQQADRYDLSKPISKIMYERDEDTGLYDLEIFDMGGGNLEGYEDLKEDQLEDKVGKEIAQKLLDGVDNTPTKEQVTEKINTAVEQWVRIEDTALSKIEIASVRNDPHMYRSDLKEVDRTITDQDWGIFLDNHNAYRNWKELSGLNLKVGGEGMKGFYDQILPAEVNKYVKRWGGRVGETVISLDSGHGPWTKNGMKTWRQDTTNVHSLDITPRMKDSVLNEGQPLFRQPEATTGQRLQDFHSLLFR